MSHIVKQIKQTKHLTTKCNVEKSKKEKKHICQGNIAKHFFVIKRFRGKLYYERKGAAYSRLFLFSSRTREKDKIDKLKGKEKRRGREKKGGVEN